MRLCIEPDVHPVAVPVPLPIRFAIEALEPRTLLASVAPDVNFGTDGHAWERGSGHSVMEVQPDGKILTAGELRVKLDVGPPFSITRFTTDGRLDPAFGTLGTGTVILTELTEDDSYIADLTVLPDGKILVTSGKRLIRLNGDGSRDVTFGDGGDVVVPPASEQELYVSHTALDPDGGIIVVGYEVPGPTDVDLVVMRFRPDGSRDASFAWGGAARPTMPPWPEDWGMTLQQDGKIVLFTNGEVRSIVRMNADGSMDAGFGSYGVLANAPINYMPDEYGDEILADVAFQSDGSLIVATEDGWSTDLRLQRFTPDGALDSSFGRKGEVRFTFVDEYYATQVFVLSDDRMIVVTHLWELLGEDEWVGISMLNADGSLSASVPEEGYWRVTSGPRWPALADARLVNATDLVLLLTDGIPDGRGLFRLKLDTTVEPEREPAARRFPVAVPAYERVPMRETIVVESDLWWDADADDEEDLDFDYDAELLA